MPPVARFSDEPETSAEFPVWGGRTHVVVTDPTGLRAAVAAVQRTIDAFDLGCSSFRGDSELAIVHHASPGPVQVGSVLLDAVDAALRAAEVTDGDVDPTVGQALVAYGFTPGFGDTGGQDPADRPAGRPADRPARRERIAIRAVPGYRTVRVDREAGTLSVGKGVRLDLGATAKALAADRAAIAAYEAAGCGVLVNLSGDLTIAGPAPAGGWRIRVTDDHRSGAGTPGQWISLGAGGLATSSTTVRRRADGAGAGAGAGAHHLIDPATGRPASEYFRTVSVAAATCLDANIASTAAIVRGARALEWLESLDLPSRLVTADGEVIHLAGWPQDGEDLGSG